MTIRDRGAGGCNHGGTAGERVGKEVSLDTSWVVLLARPSDWVLTHKTWAGLSRCSWILVLIDIGYKGISLAAFAQPCLNLVCEYPMRGPISNFSDGYSGLAKL